MFKQSVHIVNIPILYNILFEIGEILSFEVLNYQKIDNFLDVSVSSGTLIILSSDDSDLVNNNNLQINNFLILESLPIKIENLITLINTKLIKQKYKRQSKIDIKDYTVNLNSRIISKNKINLKLTEKEIDVILFINSIKNHVTVEKLQNEVWGYNSQIETHTVETHIYSLRKKIKECFDDSDFISSFNGAYLIK